MTLDFICGQLRIEARAGWGATGQFVADVVAQAAARPRKLIARATFDPDHGWGDRGPSRCANGWQVARVVGQRRVTGIIYAPHTGLPVPGIPLTVPAYRWWPQVQRAAETAHVAAHGGAHVQ